MPQLRFRPQHQRLHAQHDVGLPLHLDERCKRAVCQCARMWLEMPSHACLRSLRCPVPDTAAERV